MKKYKCLFFDLDGTLWNFEENSKAALHDIFQKYNLLPHAKNYEHFVSIYHKFNHKLWEKYRNGKIDKKTVSITRFYQTLHYFGINKMIMAKELSIDYLKFMSSKTILYPYTTEILEKLSTVYKLIIVTNGFSEVQFDKLKNTNIDKYFSSVITSDEAGALKPSPKIFEYALSKAQCSKEECIMIGDDFEVDIKAARKVGIDQIYFNFKKIKVLGKITHTINDLKELEAILL